MKKILSLLIISAMALHLAGCSAIALSMYDNPRGEKYYNANIKREEKSDIKSEDYNDIWGPNEETEIVEGEKPAFDEVVVVDNDECTIKIIGSRQEAWSGYLLEVYFENKSVDKKYNFMVDRSYINGVDVDTFFYYDLLPGKKANEDIIFSDTYLIEKGIEKYTDIELSFSVFDADDIFAPKVVEKTVNVYPYGEEEATIFVRTPQSTDTVLVDNDYATITAIEYGINDILGHEIELFIENKSDINLIFGVNDVYINGIKADPVYTEVVSARKSAFSSIYWQNSLVEKHKIKEFKNIEMRITAFEKDNLQNGNIIDETIVLKLDEEL